MASAHSAAAPFIVQGKRRNGTVTYHCPDAEWALRKLADFDRAGYTDIVAKGPDGKAVDVKRLSDLVARTKASEPAAT